MLADYLPLRELQSVLPDDRLHDIAALVRRLDNRAGYDPASDQRFLARLYEAYRGPEGLARAAERRRLLEYVPMPVLQALAARLGLKSTGDFSAVLKRVARFEWGANEPSRVFLEHFGYPADYLPEPEPACPTSENVAPLGAPLKVLREYQASVFYRSVDALRPPCARMMVQMPTGSGKTRTAMEIVSAFMNDGVDRTVLWLAHSEELCEQAADSFAGVWRHVGGKPVMMHRCWGQHSPTFPIAPPALVVGGFSKLHSMCRGGAASVGADLVVVDEAHMVLAPTFDRVVSWSKRPSARIVGLSATPGRGSGGEVSSRELAAYFNERIINIETRGAGVIETLQEQGILARVVREPLHTNVRYSLTAEEWRQLEEQLDYPEGFLRRLAEDRERNRIIAERLWSLAADGVHTIVFATSVEQSKLLCALLLYRGVTAAHIDGDTAPEARRAAIAKFKRGDIRFLLNYQVFSTGFDVPTIDVVFIARPTKSLVLYSQMVGRGMRGPAVGGTATVRLIDVIDNVMDYSGGLDSVYDYFSEYWA